MKHLLALGMLIAIATPAIAQRRLDLIVDAEGVRSSNRSVFEPNVVRYEPRFDNGGGVGAGLNWFFSDRVSFELKAAALRSRLHIRRMGSDFATVGDLGYAQIYPITALLQWHMTDGDTAVRPYVGIGAGHVILREIKQKTALSTGARFENPTGLVVDGGLEISLSSRWSVLADARYTPIETQSRVMFSGGSASRIDVKPLVVSTGIAFRF
jgi:outer membrane protein W